MRTWLRKKAQKVSSLFIYEMYVMRSFAQQLVTESTARRLPAGRVKVPRGSMIECTTSIVSSFQQAFRFCNRRLGPGFVSFVAWIRALEEPSTGGIAGMETNKSRPRR